VKPASCKKTWNFVTFAIIGIVLVTLNTRAGITCLSPIYDQIKKSFSITPIAQGILGMLPPLGFSLFGWFAPRIASRFGLAKSLLLSMFLVLGGILLRSLANDVWIFGTFFSVSLAGMAIANVLLPPTVKRYFPNQIGLLSSIYTALVPLSSGVPSLIIVPLTLSLGWRVSTGIWAGLALMATIPWFFLVKSDPESIPDGLKQHFQVWRWPTAWAVMCVFCVAATSTYAMIAWFPKILMTLSGVSQATTGIMMFGFFAADFIPCLIVPFFLARTRHPQLFIVFFAACGSVAYLGLLFFPAAAWVWVILSGLSLTMIPIGLTLVNLRSRTKEGAAELSGFVQGVGYLIAAIGPIIIGGIYYLTGGWTVSLWLLLGINLLAILFGGFAVQKKFIEDFSKHPSLSSS
jgi:CP family cyanate transporter-like MFS transporter